MVKKILKKHIPTLDVGQTIGLLNDRDRALVVQWFGRHLTKYTSWAL